MQGSEQATALLCLKSEWGKKTYGEETNSFEVFEIGTGRDDALIWASKNLLVSPAIYN
jgi:hypothetical protein